MPYTRRPVAGLVFALTSLALAGGPEETQSPPTDRGGRPSERVDSGALELKLRGWAGAGSQADQEGRVAAPPRQASGDEAEQRLLGRLLYGQLDVRAEDAPLRDVLSAFGRALEINLIAFYESPDRPAPLRAVRTREPINLELLDVDARSVLEAIAAQAGPDVTWQIHRGILEFGPRVTLARENARRIQVYEVTDLANAPPYFVVPRSHTDKFGFAPMDTGTGETTRLRPMDVVADLVRTISEQCEPQAFEPEAEPDPVDEATPAGPRPAPQHTVPTAPSKNPRRAVNTTATRNLDPDLGPVFVLGQWATIHVKDATIVVRAPDFVHRAINGYPPPIRPR